MSDKLCLWYCENFADEIAAIVESERLADVQTASFPADCSRPLQAATALEATIRATAQDCSRTCILGGCCVAGASPAVELPRCDAHTVELCFEMLCGKTMVDHFFEEGGHLLTPGWLARWQHYVDEWGFDQQTAREFFAESCTKLVLLDTGIDKKSAETLAAFAGFVDRPFVIEPVGMDYLRSFLMHLVLDWRSEVKDAQVTKATANANRQISEYAMVFDLMASLTTAVTEEEVIDRILELFAMFCAPASLAYIPFVDGKPGTLDPALASPAADEKLQQALLTLTNDHAWTESGQGFLLRITFLDEVVGVLGLDGIALPEHRNHYLNLALNVTGMCGLAIANARRYQAVRQAEKSLRQQTFELEMRNEELDAFSHTVAHDLENPLALMVGFAEFLVDEHASMTTGQMEEIYQTIARTGRKMSNIVSELLLLAGVRKAEVELAPLDMEWITMEAHERLADMIQEYGATIDLPTTWPTAWGYAPWVEEVWVNYLSNAIKYGGLPPRVVLGAEELADGTVRYWIRDNGAGLTPEEQASLFTPFTQLDQVRTKGHGLGLSIVLRIVERLGGQVGVQSEGTPGQGCTFHFTLPGFAAARPNP